MRFLRKLNNTKIESVLRRVAELHSEMSAHGTGTNQPSLCLSRVLVPCRLHRCSAHHALASVVRIKPCARVVGGSMRTAIRTYTCAHSAQHSSMRTSHRPVVRTGLAPRTSQDDEHTMDGGGSSR